MTTDQTTDLTAAERTMLAYALDQAQEKIWSEDGFTDEDQAAVTSLRRLTAVSSGGQAPATSQTAVCICGHTERQHFEDACITEITGCDCGDFIPPDAAREVIDRWREAATRKPAERTAVVAAGPVKQRADCTELEWAEQERSRFERLYTRETVRADLAEQRADTAARDADIYQQRLERLSEGYAEQRKRADAMERAMESTAADALAHRGCHRDLMAQCLRAERAEAEAERLRADRAAVLRKAADGVARDREATIPLHSAWAKGMRRAEELLRRLADEAAAGRGADDTQPECEPGCAHCGGPHAWDDCEAYTTLIQQDGEGDEDEALRAKVEEAMATLRRIRALTKDWDSRVLPRSQAHRLLIEVCDALAGPRPDRDEPAVGGAQQQEGVCPVAEPHEAHDWLPFPGSGLVHKGVVRCPGAAR